MTYCIDSSSLIGAWSRYYPPDIKVFQPVWSQIDEMIQVGSLVTAEKVKQELSKKDDDLFAWVKQRPSLFMPIDEAIQIEMRAILKVFPEMLKAGSTRNAADPYVIALAKIHGRTVVTEESGRKEPKIPQVCHAFSVPCTDIVGMMRKVGFKSGRDK